MFQSFNLQFWNSKLGKWLFLYFTSALVWFWDVRDLLVVHAEDIGSKKSPIDDPTLTVKDQSGKVWGGEIEGREGTLAQKVQPFMILLTSATFAIGFLCALAGLFANSAKLSLAIQNGNANATQKHLKDHATFYINTAIVFSTLFVIELIAWFFGIQV